MASSSSGSPSASPTLSLAMIVKNEADHLERCLSTARPHVDEIIIVDTGSTDGTPAIARRYADVFEEIEWPDSFSVARNHSFDLARGDYIMWLDGDEYIPEDEHWELLRRVLAEGDFGGLQFRFHNKLPDNQALAADCLWLTRVIRNHPRVRFEGRVHNQIDHNLEHFCRKENLSIARVQVKVVHFGYALDREDTENKYQERIPLLEHEVEHADSAKKKVYYQFQLGNAHYMIGNYERAVRVIETINFNYLSPFNAYYAHLMSANAYINLQDMERALKSTGQMFALDEEEPIGYMLAGNALLGLGQHQDALLMFLEAYERNKEDHSVRFVLNNSILFRKIGDLTAHLGMLERAEFFYQEYLNEHPDSEEVRTLLEKVETMLDQRAVQQNTE